MSYFWTTFANRSAGCIDAANIAEATTKAAAFGTVKEVRTLPYPATPRLGEHDDTPPFCYKPSECAGRSCCPQNYSCTE